MEVEGCLVTPRAAYRTEKPIGGQSPKALGVRKTPEDGTAPRGLGSFRAFFFYLKYSGDGTQVLYVLGKEGYHTEQKDHLQNLRTWEQ